MIICDNCKSNPATTCPIGDSLVSMFGLRLDPSKHAYTDKLTGARVDLCFNCSMEVQERVLAIVEPALIKGGFYDH